jgi:hypothetical protein
MTRRPIVAALAAAFAAAIADSLAPRVARWRRIAPQRGA